MNVEAAPEATPGPGCSSPLVDAVPVLVSDLLSTPASVKTEKISAGLSKIIKKYGERRKTRSTRSKGIVISFSMGDA